MFLLLPRVDNAALLGGEIFFFGQLDRAWLLGLRVSGFMRLGLRVHGFMGVGVYVSLRYVAGLQA